MNVITVDKAIVLNKETVDDILASYYQDAVDFAQDRDMAGFFYCFGIVRTLLELSGREYTQDSHHVALKRIGSKVFSTEFTNM
ncbi:hypothetical protein [Cytobacillus oceanisediminis]|uniref:hypothetical protein n=1 Tax=Cytobacillus oceanisediminis TaxID=665099 RepID=UPI001FB54D0B|nr:hypothetical protein [Cytobacillus oceanisediminis]UOE58040.1 hypothetical protein IRB79_27640 [Cytobacillus oceanisediminis]